MSQHHELYRYAAPGARILKQLQTGTRQHQARYLAGLELRTSTGQQLLLTVALGHSRTYRQGSQTYTHFNLCDRLNSVCGAVDACGNLVSRESWYPFGGTASWLTGVQAGATLKFQRYAGKERDISGLIFYGWRYYAPWKMRWINGDPAGTVEGLNLFRMVGNNPVTLRDRDGRVSDELAREIAAWLNNAEKEGSLDNIFSQVMASGDVQPTLPGTHSAPTDEHLIQTDAPGSVPGPAVEDRVQVIPASPTPGLSTDHSEFEYRCSVCNQCCATIDSLALHQKTQHGKNIPYKCSFAGCNKLFSLPRRLKYHSSTHTGDKKHECNVCSRKFGTPSELSRHKRGVHNEQLKHKCNISECGRIFSRSDNLKRHLLVFHARKNEVMPCQYCGRNYQLQRYLNAHIKNKHLSGE